MCDPEGCATVLGVVGGGGGGFVDPKPGGQRVGRSAAGLPRGASVGTPTYKPPHDPHDALIILNIQFFKKKFAHQLRLPSAKVRPRGRVGVKIFFCVFHPFLSSPQNSEHFEYRHIGSNKKFPPAVCLKQNLLHPQNPLFRTTILGSVEPPPPPLGSGPGREQPP